MSLDQLDDHVLLLVASHLTPRDLFSVMCTNKKFYNIIGSDLFWKDITRAIWFDDEEEDVKSPILTGYFDTFRERSNIDLEVERIISLIAQTESSKQFYQLELELLNIEKSHKDYSLLPILRRLALSNTHSWRVKWIADSLLRIKRHIQAINYIGTVETDINKNLVDEEFFFQWSHADPSFDKLLPYRKTFYEQARSRIRTHNDYREAQSTLKRLILVMDIVQHLLKERSSSYSEISSLLPTMTYYNSRESYSILRAYSGEIFCARELQYVIVKKLLKEIYGIDSYLSSLFLVIEDDAPDNENLLVLISTMTLGIYRLYTMEDYHSSRRSNSDLFMSGRDIHLEPMTIDYYLIKVVDFITKIKSFTGDHNTPIQGTEIFTKLYPISGRPISSITYFLSLFLRTKKQNLIKSSDIDGLWKKLEEYSVMYNPVGFDILYTLINPKHEPYGVDKLFKPLQNEGKSFKIGEIVYNRRRNFCGIIINTYVDSDGIEYCETYPASTFQERRQSKRFEHVNDQQLQHVLETLLKDEHIGRYFIRFDKEQKRFIPFGPIEL